MKSITLLFLKCFVFGWFFGRECDFLLRMFLNSAHSNKGSSESVCFIFSVIAITPKREWQSGYEQQELLRYKFSTKNKKIASSFVLRKAGVPFNYVELR